MKKMEKLTRLSKEKTNEIDKNKEIEMKNNEIS